MEIDKWLQVSKSWDKFYKNNNILFKEKIEVF